MRRLGSGRNRKFDSKDEESPPSSTDPALPILLEPLDLDQQARSTGHAGESTLPRRSSISQQARIALDESTLRGSGSLSVLNPCPFHPVGTPDQKSSQVSLLVTLPRDSAILRPNTSYARHSNRSVLFPPQPLFVTGDHSRNASVLTSATLEFGLRLSDAPSDYRVSSTSSKHVASELSQEWRDGQPSKNDISGQMGDIPPSSSHRTHEAATQTLRLPEPVLQRTIVRDL